MRRLAALAVGWMLAVGCAWAQTGYQAEPIAPDPALKSVQIPESVLMRAAYEARHQDCVDARQHLDAVEKERPDWAPGYAVRLICARSEGQDTEERATLDKLTKLQWGDWEWWNDSAVLHAKAVEFAAAVSDLNHAIDLRTWDAALYAQRSEWREQLGDAKGAYADALKVHELEPALGAPLERMAKLAQSVGYSTVEAQQMHALAELNPGDLPMEVRDDSELPTAKMQLQEILLRASYALRVNNYPVALKLVRATLQRWPKTAAALEMYYPLWKNGLVEVDQARAAVTELVQPGGAQGASAGNGRGAGAAAVIRPEYYEWLLEMGVPQSEQIQIYRRLIAMEPVNAKNYADLAGVELQLTAAHGAREPSLPTAVPGLNGVPPLPSGNPVTQDGARPAPLPHSPLPHSPMDGLAEEDYRRAINLDPSQPAYYYGLAMSLEKRAAFPLETMALNMALIGDPDNQEYQSARASLPGRE